MSIPITSQLELNAQLPLDDRTWQVDQTAREAIIDIQRYDGLTVYQTDTQKTWQLQGGITNSDWVDISTSGVTQYWTQSGGFLYPTTATDNIELKSTDPCIKLPTLSTFRLTDGTTDFFGIKQGAIGEVTMWCGAGTTGPICWIIGSAGSPAIDPTKRLVSFQTGITTISSTDLQDWADASEVGYEYIHSFDASSGSHAIQFQGGGGFATLSGVRQTMTGISSGNVFDFSIYAKHTGTGTLAIAFIVDDTVNSYLWDGSISSWTIDGGSGPTGGQLNELSSLTGSYAQYSILNIPAYPADPTLPMEVVIASLSNDVYVDTASLVLHGGGEWLTDGSFENWNSTGGIANELAYIGTDGTIVTYSDLYVAGMEIHGGSINGGSLQDFVISHDQGIGGLDSKGYDFTFKAQDAENNLTGVGGEGGNFIFTCGDAAGTADNDGGSFEVRLGLKTGDGSGGSFEVATATGGQSLFEVAYDGTAYGYRLHAFSGSLELQGTITNTAGDAVIDTGNTEILMVTYDGDPADAYLFRVKNGPVTGYGLTEILFTGTGAEDLSWVSQSWNGTGVHTWKVEIDGDGSPNTFKWYYDGGLIASNVNILGASQDLDSGTDIITIYFSSATGHVIGDTFEFRSALADDMFEVRSAGGIYCGANANATDFPLAFSVISQSNTGKTFSSTAGLVVECSANEFDITLGAGLVGIGKGYHDATHDISGFGVYGIGYSGSNSNSANTYGVYGIVTDTSVGRHIAIGANATGGSDAYCFYGFNGEHFTNGGITVHRTPVAAGGYTVQIEDYILGVASITLGGDFITIPTTLLKAGRSYIIKDESGDCSVGNPLMILPQVGVGTLIDGSVSFTMDTPYQSVEIYSNGTDWFIY